MPGRQPVPPQLLTGPFRLDEARRLGVSGEMLRGRRFRGLFRGIYVCADVPDSREMRADAARLAVGVRSVFSHETAAELRGLPVPVDERVHLTIPEWVRRPRFAGIVVHAATLVRSDLATFHARPMTSATRTFVDLARRLSLVDLVILGDAMLRRGFANADQLLAGASQSRSPGRRAAGAAARLVRPRVDSPMETRVRLIAVLAGLPCPDTGVEILDEYGQWVATVDMAYVAQKIVIEYDGDLHRTSSRKWRHDAYVGQRLRQLGWEVITLTADDVVERPLQTLERLHEALRVRGHGPSAPTVNAPWQRHFTAGRGLGRCA